MEQLRRICRHQMIMNVNSMNFPVLRINEFHIRRFQSPSELKLMSQKYLENNKFKEKTFFIDSKGIKWTLLDTRWKRKSLNPFRWSRRSPAIIIDHKIEQSIQLTIDDIKNIILTMVLKEKWHRQGHQSEAQFRNMIADTNSIPEIINAISFYGDWVG